MKTNSVPPQAESGPDPSEAPTMPEIAFEVELRQPQDTVWRALTERELLGAWLLPNDIQVKPGARFSFRPVGPLRAGEERIDCEILEARRPELLRYSWSTVPTRHDGPWLPSSVVTFELLPTAEGGTLLRLTQRPSTASLNRLDFKPTEGLCAPRWEGRPSRLRARPAVGLSRLGVSRRNPLSRQPRRTRTPLLATGRDPLRAPSLQRVA